MKKTILLFGAFILFSLLSFPKPAEAIYVKVTFNIGHVWVPVRAVAAATPLPPNTEMEVRGYQVDLIIYSGSAQVASKKLGTKLSKALSGNFIVFRKETGKTYIPSIRLTTYPPSSTAYPYLDCSPAYGVYSYSIGISQYPSGDVYCPPPSSFTSATVPGYPWLYFDFPSI